MDYYNTKCFIIILLGAYLVQNNNGSIPTERQIECAEAIQKFYGGHAESPFDFAYYGVLYIRIAEEIPNGIKVVPPKDDNGQIEGSSSRGVKILAPKGSPVTKVYNLVDLMSGIIERETPPIVPDHVKNYYKAITPHLEPRNNFKPPSSFCQRFKEEDDVEKCINQVIESFDLSLSQENYYSNLIIQKIYKNYIISELNLETQEYAFYYINHVSRHFKLGKVHNKKMHYPLDFCKIQFPSDPQE